MAEKKVDFTLTNGQTNGCFEKAEEDRLRSVLQRTYADRFRMMTTLMKMNQLFRNAKITHQPFKNSPAA